MPPPRDFLFGPWRAVSVLGITQILAWGMLFYPPVLTVPLIAADRGWSVSFGMAGFSLALFVGGLVSPRIGALIDRHGGHVVMAAGSLVAAAGLAMLVLAAHPAAYLAVWMLLGVGMAAQLYDPAFASLGRIFGAAARRPITVLTLAGGFASTVGWPAARLLLDTVGWRGAYLAYAAVMVVVVAPLHAFALPRQRFAPLAPRGEPGKPAAPMPSGTGLVFVLVAAAFGAYAFVPSGLSAHLLAILERSGIDAATAVLIGALFGPAQVAARIGELVFGRALHPLLVARAAVGLLIVAFVLVALFGLPLAAAIAFVIMFGVANGLITITRGALPLALFGPVGYGAVIGRLAGPWLVMQSVAPLALAVVIERTSDAGALATAAGFAVLAFLCLLAIRRRGD